MDDYRKYLAQQILTEDKLVTYRLLSRTLKVHVNTAKEMLYDFHKWQNDKHSGTLHATYLVYGIKKTSVQQDGDIEMTDEMSDDESPFSDEVPTYTLSLVKEEQLEEALKQYEQVSSIHVNSLEPHPMKDLQLLVDASQQALKISAEDDSPSALKIYGTPTNPHVRKRERRGGMPKAAPSAPAAKAAPSKAPTKQETKPTSAAAVIEEPKAAPAPVINSKPHANAAKKTSAAPLKRQGSSGTSSIGHMFAKAAAKPKKPKPAVENTAPAAEAENPALSDEGEDDSEMPDVVPSSNARGTRKDRQEALRRMMEESDEDEPEEKADSPEPEPMEEEPPSPEPESKDKEGPAEVVSGGGNGRRRGRRRVTKKKQIMDDQGYLVTQTVDEWESFSEDEASTPPSKPNPKHQVEKSAPAAKPKKGGKGGGAQGSIMSFFAKK